MKGSLKYKFKNPDLLNWLLESGEPWTRYHVMVDLLGYQAQDERVTAARQEMTDHPWVQKLLSECAEWGDRPIQRHNDSSHPIHKLGVLADFGLRLDDPGLVEITAAILNHQSNNGALESPVNISRAFGGTGEDQWSWMLCDAPILSYVLQTFGLGADPRLERTLEHLACTGLPGGWGCVVAPELGKFRGPGRKSDPCPIANVYALRALSLSSQYHDSPATHSGVEMLLRHWENRCGPKIYMFGIGSDYCKLKYPFVWYDILHVVEVLSYFPFARSDRRFLEMVSIILEQANSSGQYTAGSMYMPWKGWSFADKKTPSPWLTFLVLRMQQRLRLA